MLKAVVFDMDGVILDSERLAREAWRQLAAEDGLPDIDEMYLRCMGRSSGEIAALFRERYGYDGYPAFEARTYRWCEEHAPGGVVPLREGARELLEFLKQRGTKLGLATATAREIAEKELDNAGVLAYFDIVIGGDMVRSCKPDPEIYLTACRLLDVLPEETYGVEDGRNGILALHAAGMPVIMAVDQYHPEPEIAALCEVVLPSMCDVRDYLNSAAGLP